MLLSHVVAARLISIKVTFITVYNREPKFVRGSKAEIQSEANVLLNKGRVSATDTSY
jgi:hypothetical protein